MPTTDSTKMEIYLEQFQETCKCGSKHSLFVKKILIRPDAIEAIDAFLEAEGIHHYPMVLCDTNTYEAAAEKVLEALTSRNKTYVVLEAQNLHADEEGIEAVLAHLRGKETVLLAVGAGTIHDIARYIAKLKNLPFVAVPTAASVDGFVSTVAAMTIKGFKVTYPAVSPIAVFADTTIFKNAPYRLTASGVSDLLGKYTALLDWQIAHILTREYLCEKVIAIELQAIESVTGSLESLRQGSEEAYEHLMYALLLSGLAMQMVGNSRPASGAEHHMSHLWEMQVINGPLEAFHGEKVGVALPIVCDRYKAILKLDPDKDWTKHYKGLPHHLLKENFKDLYEAIIEENAVDLMEDIKFSSFIGGLEEIKQLVKHLPSGKEIRELLEKAGAKVTLQDIGLEESIKDKSIKLSPFVRRRLTLMRILNSIDEIV